MTTSIWLRGAVGLVLMGAGLVGCANLIGLEKRTETDGGAGGSGTGGGSGSVVDEETGITTTQQCIEYCDDVLAVCIAADMVYTTRETCLGVCGALEPGDENEPIGNTVACRHRQAQNAASLEAPDEFCPAAGPAGGEACGDDCEAYCQLLEAACPDEHDEVLDCVSSCAGLTDGGPFNTVDYYTGDTLDCRLIHVSAAFPDPEAHCQHSKFSAESVCTDIVDTGEPSCDVFCRNVMSACPGDRLMYESESQCMATCAQWPTGDLADRMVLTQGCRQFHAKSALLEPEVHCHHLGPGGDGVCTAVPAEGNCEGYCFMMAAVCPAEFATFSSDQDTCKTACLEDFAEDGAAVASGYDLILAAEGGLQCRMLNLSRAAEGVAAPCDHVLVSQTCPE
jgi:hypothetical protein